MWPLLSFFIRIISCEALSVDVHVMPLGELYRFCWFLGYFDNFRDTQEHITWKLLFQMGLHILLTNKTTIDTIKSLSNEWHWEIQMFPLNSIFHGWPISVIRLDPVLTSRLVLVSNPAGSHPLTARLAESHLFMWLGYSSVWKILNGTAHSEIILLLAIASVSSLMLEDWIILMSFVLHLTWFVWKSESIEPFPVKLV